MEVGTGRWVQTKLTKLHMECKSITKTTSDRISSPEVISTDAQISLWMFGVADLDAKYQVQINPKLLSALHDNNKKKANYLDLCRTPCIHFISFVVSIKRDDGA